LEEPPPHVIFVLATTEFHKIPSTIRSRCLIFQLQAPPATEFIKYLTQFCEQRSIPYDSEVLATIAQQADGSYRDLLNIVEYSLALTNQRLDDKTLFGFFSTLSSQDVARLIDYVLKGNNTLLKQELYTYFDQGLSPEKLIKQMMSWVSEQEACLQQPFLQFYQDPEIHKVHHYDFQLYTMPPNLFYFYIELVFLWNKEFYKS
jgi:DNA polymerase-3 subunit gamma/tau